MKRIIITESQLKHILGEDYSNYLPNVEQGAEVPDNAYGTDVTVNNTDKDAEPSVTVTDNPASKRSRQNRLFARSTRYIAEDVDDEKVAGMGKKTDAFIAQMANNGGGKMVKNINNRLNGGGGQRLNTTEVEISRMKQAKKDDPSTYVANGGDVVLNALKKTKNQQRQTNAVKNDAANNIENIMDNGANSIPDATKGTGKGHHSEENIYYY